MVARRASGFCALLARPRSSTMRRWIVLLIALLLPAGTAIAQPARDEVVARNLLSPSVKQTIAALAAQSGAGQSERISRARALISEGRTTGDPRTLGYAEAVLARAEPDDSVLVLRATIEQSRHRFSDARALLDRVLARNPHDAQALLTRSTIGVVTGDYASATTDCRALAAVHVEAGAICLAQVELVSGDVDRAGRTLSLAVRRSEGPLLAWAFALQGQLFEQQGAARSAIVAYRNALQISDDLVTRLNLADALLSDSQFAAVEQLLRDAPAADGALLRRWIGGRASGRSDPALEARLSQRFSEAQARGELLHAREAAMFALARGEPREALDLARVNWRSQREPADIIVFAQAARAADDRAALAELKAWVRRAGMRDVRVERALGESAGASE